LIILLTMRKPSVINIFRLEIWDMSAHGAGDRHGFIYPGIALISVVLTLVFTILCVGFFAHNMYMAAENITSVEMCNKGVNPYELPTAEQNIQQLMGEWGFWWFIPVAPVNRGCNGTRYPTIKKCEDEEYGTFFEGQQTRASVAEKSPGTMLQVVS